MARVHPRVHDQETLGNHNLHDLVTELVVDLDDFAEYLRHRDPHANEHEAFLDVKVLAVEIADRVG